LTAKFLCGAGAKWEHRPTTFWLYHPMESAPSVSVMGCTFWLLASERLVSKTQPMSNNIQ